MKVVKGIVQLFNPQITLFRLLTPGRLGAKPRVPDDGEVSIYGLLIKKETRKMPFLHQKVENHLCSTHFSPCLSHISCVGSVVGNALTTTQTLSSQSGLVKS